MRLTMVEERMPTAEHHYHLLDENCASRRAVELIGNKWTMLVIFALAGGTKRYGEMQRMIVDVSQKMLTQTLRELEESGLVHREVYPVIPPKVEYSLTPLGETLLDPILAIKHWSETYMDQVTAFREQSTQRD
jgi:DNA-binding HxlR family transcriptional regulator